MSTGTNVGNIGILVAGSSYWNNQNIFDFDTEVFVLLKHFLVFTQISHTWKDLKSVMFVDAIVLS